MTMTMMMHTIPPPMTTTTPQRIHHQNSYIYNKYFQNNQYDQGQQHRPMTPLEYRDMLIKNIIQKHKIKQMKSTKLVMPNSNINFASGPTSNLNKLFGILTVNLLAFSFSFLFLELIYILILSII